MTVKVLVMQHRPEDRAAYYREVRKAEPRLVENKPEIDAYFAAKVYSQPPEWMVPLP